MLARAQTFTIDGLQARPVTVEVDIRSGLPAFSIVGLADAAVREARDRVRAAILNSDFEFPARRITANLAPADLPKIGPGLDLALACAVLAASGQIPGAQLDGHGMFGELALDGELRHCHGTLAVAQASVSAGVRTLLLAPGRAHEAMLLEGLNVKAVQNLKSAVRVLHGGSPDRIPDRPALGRGQRDDRGRHDPDLSDIIGQHHAVRSLIIAAAGGHNALLSGPPGTGKTMLAHRLPSILPPLSRTEAIDVTRIHGIAGHGGGRLITHRPFRAPHHSITTAGLVGGARRGWIGEIVLAHHGVLFLDELSEFARPTLEALRQPMEDGRVAIVRARHSAVYPARFMLLAATNPCPCGYAGEHERCHCNERDHARHRRKLSGPLLDRIDLLSHLDRERGVTGAVALTDSRRARARVIAARELQAARFATEGIRTNAAMDARLTLRHANLDDQANHLLIACQDRGSLSARGQHRALRVARTIADLEHSTRIAGHHLAEALAMRPDAALAGGRTVVVA
jgi:magnesium chelatase family protein